VRQEALGQRPGQDRDEAEPDDRQRDARTLPPTVCAWTLAPTAVMF